MEEFYRQLNMITKNIFIYPCEFSGILYDERFTDSNYIQYIKLSLSKSNHIDFKLDGGKCFRLLFDKLYRDCNTDISTYICDSQDINEDETIYGDFSYYVINYHIDSDIIPVLFMKSSHYLVYPDRCIIYGNNAQFEVSTYNPFVDIYKVVISARDIILSKKICDIKNYLTTFDRPVL